MAKIDYYLIHRWMREELHLDDTELHCYAVIYSLSKGDNWFNAGVKNIMDILGKSKPTIINALKSLTKKELIAKVPVVVNNAKRFYYKATNTIDEEGLNDFTKGRLNDFTKGRLNDFTSNNNKVNNKEIKSKSISNDIQKRVFQKPTVEQVEAYIQEKGLHFDAERFVDHYESKGWMIGKNKMKDWKAACRTWEHIRNSQEKEKEEKENPDTSASDWDAQMRWLEKNTPNIAGRMTKEMLRRFKELCMCDSHLLADTLREFDKIYDGGNIMKEFEELCKRR